MSYIPFFWLIASTYFVTSVPVEPMREYPDASSQVVSQTFFSEEVQIIDKVPGWVYIESSDGYRGWASEKGITERDSPYSTQMSVSRLSAHLYAVSDVCNGPAMTLPYGAALQVEDDSDPRWLTVILPQQTTAYIQKGDMAPKGDILEKKDLAEFSKRFLGLPYTWGGRSSFGYDCSGFVQMLYGKIGIALQRDARQQILDPRFKTIPQDELESGDLIFFGASPDKITHVGLYLENNLFIHTSGKENKPWLRISSLNDPEWSGTEKAFSPYRTFKQLNCSPSQ